LTWILKTVILTFSNILSLVVKGGRDCINNSYTLTAISDTKLHMLRNKKGKSNKEGGKSFYFEIG
jgi:hypothetical protein